MLLLPYILILIMVLGHWLGDFILQSDETAVLKHKDFNHQCIHALSYSTVWLVIGVILMGFNLFNISFIQIFLFFGITSLTHLLVDLFVSKFGYKYFHNSRPNSFLGIMHVDQLLHYTQLFLTYKIIF